MNQKGFANIVLIVLVVVLAGALGYVTLVKKSTPTEQSQTNNSQNTQPTTPPPTNNTVSQNPPATQPPATPPSSLPTTCVDQSETKAVITSLTSYYGPVGTKLEIRGCNFAGFEGDKNAVIENAQGVKGILYGEQGSTAKVIKVTLKSPLCSQDNSYSGLPCSSYLTLTSGTYKIWTMPWDATTKSNLATFTIQ